MFISHFWYHFFVVFGVAQSCLIYLTIQFSKSSWLVSAKKQVKACRGQSVCQYLPMVGDLLQDVVARDSYGWRP